MSDQSIERACFDIEATSLDPENGGVVCISVSKAYSNGETECEVFMVEDRVVDPDTGDAYPTVSEQLRVINKFVEYMSDLPRDTRIFGYNSSTYDFMYLISKAAKADDYGSLVEDLFELKQRHELDIFKRHKERTGDWPKLEDLCSDHGIEHDSEMGGADVKQFFEDGRLEEIEDYAEEDVVATDKLAAKLFG